MKKFQFIITRDITESCVIIVEGKDEDEATDAALGRVFDNDIKWETDDGNWARPYITDVEEIEE